MRRIPAWLAILLTAALVLVACSSDGDDSGEPPAESEPTATATDLGGTPTKAEMRSALLGLEDMPSGWSAGDYDPESKDNVCPAEVAGPLGLPKEPPSVGVQYLVNPLRGPSLSEAIQIVPAGRGGELMSTVRETMATCEGTVYSGRTAHVTELDFPRVGDESAAYTIELGGLPIHAVYVVSGDIAMIMSAYDFGGGDPVGLLRTYVPKAVDRAVRVLS